jgi:hypothetical protein
MGNVDLTLTVRPIKIAFLVELSDIPALHTTIQINSFLWGGSYNPIVPIFQRKPKNWEPSFPSRLKPTDIVLGYLDAYDPDFVVPVGNCAKRKWDLGHRNLIQLEDVYAPLDEYFSPAYGIGLFETLNYLHEEEFKFTRQQPLNIIFPKIGSKHSLFLESVFGVLPKSIDDVVEQNFDSRLHIQRPKISILRYYKYLGPDFLFPRRISMWKIKADRQDPFSDEGQCVFLLDATKPLDVIDYWNLRAIGWNVVPVPVQVAAAEGLRTIAEKFIEETYLPYRYNENMYHRATILNSRHVSEEEFSNFAQSLRLQPPVDRHNPKYLVQWWQPRIWDNWAREKDGAECCNLIVRSQEYQLTDAADDNIAVRTVDPPMIFGHVFVGKPRFANDVNFRFQGQDHNPMAEVIPQGGPELARSIGATGLREWRMGRRGVIYLSSHSNEKMLLKFPRAESVFMSWLREHDWEVELSAPGKIAKQMIKQLGGHWWLRFLARPRLVSLLANMADGKTLSKQKVWSEVRRMTNEEGFGADPTGLIQRLTDQDIIRLGLLIQCPMCQQHSWHALNKLDYMITCEKCLEEFRVPTHTPDDLKWAYRGHGTFSLPKRAYGAYASLLTLRFFSQVLNGATTPIMSFSAKKGRSALEADLGLFYQEDILGPARTELIFAECKTHNAFLKKDVSRMKVLANSFPGAVIVFATLREELTEREIRMIEPLANKGRGHWRDGRSYNPVLVLTATELFADYGLETSWKQKGGRDQELSNRHRLIARLLPLCDLTQQLYLRMPSLTEWLEKGRERRQLALMKRKKH